MKVSIIIPIYNVEKYLSECIKSVLDQTYKELEVILVDDGSTDMCSKICDSFAEIDERIQTVHKKNGGLADARNTGLTYVTGDYVMFLDADDFWDDRRAVEKLINRARKTRPDILSFLYKKYYEKREEKRKYSSVKNMPMSLVRTEDQLQYLMQHSIYIASACNKMIRMELFRDGKLRFKTGRISEDVEWCARLMAEARRFDYIEEAFYCYRQRETSITHSFDSKSCNDLAYNVFNCIKTAREADKQVKFFLYQYSAYQYATFFAVQARAKECPENCYKAMDKLSGILRYHGNNRKVTILYLLNRVLGFRHLCWILRKTKDIW